jgi:outer membrane protein TolC
MMQGIAVESGCLRKVHASMARTTVLGCVLGFGGCAASPNFTRPTPPPAARYTADTLRGERASANDTAQHLALGREVAGDWWSLFRSDAIDQLVKQAVAHNRSLEASTATLRRAQELALAQAGTRYPQVDLTAGVGRQPYGKEFLGPNRNTSLYVLRRRAHRELHARLYRRCCAWRGTAVRAG